MKIQALIKQRKLEGGGEAAKLEEESEGIVSKLFCFKYKKYMNIYAYIFFSLIKV